MSDFEKNRDGFDDLEFISHESVRDTSKAAEGAVIQNEHVSKKKTKRRSVDAEAAKKEKAQKIAKKHLHLIIIGVVLLIVLLALLSYGIRSMMAKKAALNKEQPISTQEYETDEYEQINEVIANYYACYADGDTDTIISYAYPMSDTERSYIQMYSAFIESYENIVCYTKTAEEEDTYIVSVAFDVKYTDLDETATGMDFFYVHVNEDSAYIDNTYSPFNMLYQEYSLDQAIVQLMQAYEESDDVILLQASVQTRYEQAITQSETLQTMIEVTIADAVAAWYEEYQAIIEEKAAQAAAQVQQELEAEEAAAAAEEAEAEDSSEADTSEASESTQTTTTSSTNAWVNVPEGSTITLTSSVNVRVSMSESADRLGLAYAGETVYVVQNYSEGWTKVTWNGQTGYIRTDVLAEQ